MQKIFNILKIRDFKGERWYHGKENIFIDTSQENSGSKRSHTYTVLKDTTGPRQNWRG